MKIAVDVDGVLIDCIPHLIDAINKKYSTNYKREEVTSWGVFYNEWGIKEKDFWKLFKQTSENIMDYPIIDDISSHIIFLLNLYNDVDIVTAELADTELVIKKLESMGIKGGLTYHKLIHIKDPKKHKTDLDYDIFIDDNPNMVNNIKDDQVLLLFTQIWNKYIKTTKYSNVMRVNGWYDLLINFDMW